MPPAHNVPELDHARVVLVCLSFVLPVEGRVLPSLSQGHPCTPVIPCTEFTMPSSLQYDTSNASPELDHARVISVHLTSVLPVEGRILPPLS